MEDQGKTFDRQAHILQTILIYAGFSAGWILFSDIALDSLFSDPVERARVGILKGWLFVAITTLLLYGLLRRPSAGFSATEAEARSRLPKLSMGLLPWPQPIQHLLAVAMSVAMLVIRDRIVNPGSDRPVVILLMFPIILAAALGGIGPGLTATFVTAAGAWLFIIAPQGLHSASLDLMTWAFLLINGALVSVLAGLAWISRQRTTQVLAERVRDLKLMAAISDGSEDAIYAKDRDGRYILFNRAASRFVGKSVDEVLGHDDRDLFPPEQAESLIAVGQAVMEKNCTLSNEEILDTVDGRRIFLATKGPLYDERGELIGLFGISRDITGLKRAERALRESEDRYRNLFMQSPDAIFVNEDGRIALVNESCCRLFNAEGPEDLIGKSPLELFHPDFHEIIEARIRQMLETGVRAPPLEEKIVRLDGCEVAVEVLASPFSLGSANAIHVILRDITARKAAEKELFCQTEELAQRNEELERFNRAVVGRELDMISLKQEVNELSRQLGREPVYPLGFAEEGEVRP